MSLDFNAIVKAERDAIVVWNKNRPPKAKRLNVKLVTLDGKEAVMVPLTKGMWGR